MGVAIVGFILAVVGMIVNQIDAADVASCTVYCGWKAFDSGDCTGGGTTDYSDLPGDDMDNLNSLGQWWLACNIIAVFVTAAGFAALLPFFSKFS